MAQRAHRLHPSDFVVDMRNVGVERRGSWILDGVSWRVTTGEHWAIVGANGSGKTSLLHVLLSYLPATRGEFSLLGRRLL